MFPDHTSPPGNFPRPWDTPAPGHTPAWQPPPAPGRPHRIVGPPAAWGEPIRALIDPALCGGFVLLAEFSKAGWRRTGVNLGTRWDTYATPLPGEVAAADAGLTRLGLIRTQPWAPGSQRGSLTAAVTRAPRPAGWCSRLAARLSRLITFPQRKPLVGPGTTPDGKEARR